MNRIAFLVIAVCILLTACGNSNQNKEPVFAEEQREHIETATPAPMAEQAQMPAQTPRVSASPKPTGTPKPTLNKDKVETGSISQEITVGEKNALLKAESYLSFTNFSYQGIIHQLENYEEFSHAEAVFAADHCGADWLEQALKAARSHLAFSSYSYQGIINQLEKYAYFSHTEAVYAADNCGADWMEQAEKKAIYYTEKIGISKSKLEKQLQNDGFTEEEVAHGVEAAGY